MAVVAVAVEANILQDVKSFLASIPVTRGDALKHIDSTIQDFKTHPELQERAA